MGRYRKRPVEVEAIHWTGPENTAEVFAFLGLPLTDSPTTFCAVDMGGVSYEWGDWIVKHSDGQTAPVKAEHFTKIYEAVN
jgi:hypothetical protein